MTEYAIGSSVALGKSHKDGEGVLLVPRARILPLNNILFYHKNYFYIYRLLWTVC